MFPFCFFPFSPDPIQFNLTFALNAAEKSNFFDILNDLYVIKSNGQFLTLIELEEGLTSACVIDVHCSSFYFLCSQDTTHLISSNFPAPLSFNPPLLLFPDLHVLYTWNVIPQSSDFFLTLSQRILVQHFAFTLLPSPIDSMIAY